MLLAVGSYLPTTGPGGRGIIKGIFEPDPPSWTVTFLVPFLTFILDIVSVNNRGTYKKDLVQFLRLCLFSVSIGGAAT